tara:strand:- start:67 stop:876 length:810 start_codon:yes stop_codon:yes gene_type:complete
MSVNKKNELLKTYVSNTGIMRISLNDPVNLNALSEKMIDSMHDYLDKAASNDKVRVIIIASEGLAFSSGHDLKELRLAKDSADKGKNFYKKIMKKCSKMMQAIINNPKPVIAEVGGTATAAGCQLVASCDLAYASRSAKFATPGVNIGLFCSTPMVALSRSLSNKHSLEMLLTGDLISSEKAYRIGLINEVLDDKELRNFVETQAFKISKKSSMTLKTGKKAFYKQINMNLSDAYNYASKIMVENMLKLDAEEGINAFIEKRQPRWHDK